jgi:LmbE family N-acetylglucosaminyl deacetylase
MKWIKQLPYWLKLLLVLLILFGLALLGRSLEKSLPQAAVSDLTPLSLESANRILVLAPHCDDETLGAGGLILAALRSGAQVLVVIATNGDGYVFATMEEFARLYPSAQDYVRMGEVRQQESLAALKVLGVDAENVTFLSYPDRGTPSLWRHNWQAADPYHSAYTNATRSPYPITYDPQSVYAGEDYLADLVAIIDEYRPDLIVYPHPDDAHPDHWGLNVFTRLALTELAHEDPAYQLAQATYLVHRPDFPTVMGLLPTGNLTPPPALYQVYQDWLRWDLDPQDTASKGDAVDRYVSQVRSLRKLMESFVRANELFAPVYSLDLPAAALGDPLDPATWQDAGGKQLSPVQYDPVNDFIFRDTIPAADLSAVYAALDPQANLWLCAQAIKPTRETIDYSLNLKALTDNGILSYTSRTRNPKAGEASAALSGEFYCSQVSLAELGNPWAIFLGAEVESPDANIPFDRTAWQMMYLHP